LALPATAYSNASKLGSAAFSDAETAEALMEMTLSISKVQDWVSGYTANNGILLKMETESDDMFSLASSEHAMAEYRPVLSISYTLPPAEPTEEPTASETPTETLTPTETATLSGSETPTHTPTPSETSTPTTTWTVVAVESTGYTGDAAARHAQIIPG
jgi:hypothetical protein